MEQDNLYGIFHILSRIIVLFAVIVLITGLIIRFNQNSPKTKSFITNQKSAEPTSLVQHISTSAAELNLKDSFTCNFSSPAASVSAFIKDNKAYGWIKEQSKTTTILLKGDCVYFWENISSEGKKICGIAPYISIIGQMPLASLLGNNQLLTLFGAVEKNKIDMIPSILNSCKKEEIKDEAVFNPPKNVIFKESKTK